MLKLVGISCRLSKTFFRMTIQNGLVVPAKSCFQEGNKRNALRWDLSPPEIRAMTDSLISRVNRVYDEVGALKIENVSVENTLKALANIRLEYACKSVFPSTHMHEHTHLPAVRWTRAAILDFHA